MSKKMDDLTRFLQRYAPTAPAAPAELEDQLLLALGEEEQPKTIPLFRRKVWPMVSSAVAAAALIAGIVWFHHESVEQLQPIAQDMEKSWDGVLVDNHELGLQSLFSDLD